jgi:hypothetical protein
MSFRNRIVKHADVDPFQLEMHELNWRSHSVHQQDAVLSALEAIGWVQRVIVSVKTNRVLDGHLRVQLARERGETSLPVRYVKVSEDEERLILATFDPIAALAGRDKAKVKDLIDRLPESVPDGLLPLIEHGLDPRAVERALAQNQDVAPATDPQDVAADESAPESGSSRAPSDQDIRTVQMYFNPAQRTAFDAAVSVLSVAYAIDNESDLVLEALRRSV